MDRGGSVERAGTKVPAGAVAVVAVAAVVGVVGGGVVVAVRLVGRQVGGQQVVAVDGGVQVLEAVCNVHSTPALTARPMFGLCLVVVVVW